MNRTTGDRLITFLVISFIAFGAYNWWLVYQQTRTTNQISKVASSGLFGVNTVWYVIGTVVGVPVLMGGYFIIRRANQSI